jgi:asparagine synthase (glutamine-hydrolysing)
MAGAIIHRGPDEAGFHRSPGVGFASRRLSIVDLDDGRQPVWNEDRTVVAVFNGELFDHREQRAALESQGHSFRSTCDSEILVHLWEEYGEKMFERLRGQFAFAIYDKQRRQLILARDRVGICPLHYAVRGDWLYFGSEIKAILASGRVPARADALGLDHIFTFFSMPSRRTAFEGVSAVVPGQYLKLSWNDSHRAAEVSEHTYWDLDFPDQGDEYDPPGDQLIDEFDAAFQRAVELRLRADVPVTGYLSGGIDSAMVLAVASRQRTHSIPSFTVKIADPRLDETARAMAASQAIGTRPTVLRCDNEALANAYPRMIEAADCPVVDTSCAALLLLSGEVNRQGYKVALTGEGSDEALAGYPWFKFHRLLRMMDCGRFRPSSVVSRSLRRVVSWAQGCSGDIDRIDRLMSGAHAQSGFYHAVAMSRRRFYSDTMFTALDGRLAYDDLELNLERMRRWHPLNQSLYLGYKTMLPGLLLNHKGDRVAMANSVETRYPFLDEDVIALCARVHPRWKLRGLRRDKHLLRCTAERYLPAEIAARPKAMFRAPFADTFFSSQPRYVAQLLSHESLMRTPYFDAQKVRAAYSAYCDGRRIPVERVFLEMGLTSVLATQLWHHQYLGGGLCELPTWSAGRPERIAASA